MYITISALILRDKGAGKARQILRRPSHNPQLRELALISGSHSFELAMTIHSSLAARSTQ